MGNKITSNSIWDREFPYFLFIFKEQFEELAPVLAAELVQVRVLVQVQESVRGLAQESVRELGRESAGELAQARVLASDWEYRVEG